MSEEKTYQVYLTCFNCDHKWVKMIEWATPYYGQSKCPNCGCHDSTRRSPTEQERIAEGYDLLDPTPKEKTAK